MSSESNLPVGRGEPPEPVPGHSPTPVGDPPGSASYFGNSYVSGGQHLHAVAHTHEGDASEPPVGDPPGSPTYYGQTQAPAADYRDVSAIGDPPGSPAYFGYTSPESQMPADAGTPALAKQHDTGPTAAQTTGPQHTSAGPIHGHLMGYGPACR